MNNLYAIVSNSAVSNVILWDGVTVFAVAEGSSLVAIPEGQSVSTGWSYDGSVFAAPIPPAIPLATAQATQVSVLTAACQNAIYAGFTSTALGAAYTYPAKDTDQQNLASSVLASLMPANATGWTTPFWCADANGAWAFVNHTVAQIQQVGIDGKTAILAAMGKNATLAAQVMAATTLEAVSAITW